MPLRESDKLIICHFDLVVTADLLNDAAQILPAALTLLGNVQQLDESAPTVADLENTLNNCQLFHHQAYASTEPTRLIKALIVLHEPYQIVSEYEEFVPYSGCREIQAIEGYLDDTSYADFLPLKYVSKTAQTEAQTPGKGPDSPGASGGASAAAGKQDIAIAAKVAPTTASGGSTTPASGGLAKDTMAAKTTRTTSAGEPLFQLAGVELTQKAQRRSRH
jgi:hypothetical protein